MYWSSVGSGVASASATARSIRASASDAASRSASASHSPRRSRYARRRGSGSRLAPLLDLVGRLVAARVVGGGVGADAIGQRLDKRRSLARARALDGPVADAAYTASASLPSTSTPVTPCASPFWASVSLRRSAARAAR